MSRVSADLLGGGVPDKDRPFEIKDADPDLRVVDDALLELLESADLFLCTFLFGYVPDSAEKRFYRIVFCFE